jgi:hypothetical protein
MLIGTSLLFTTSRVNVQNDVITDIRERLVQQHIPVKSAVIASRIPFEIEIVLQSNSTGKLAMPDDALFEHITYREMARARRRGIKIDSATVTIVNSIGKIITSSNIPVDKAIDTAPVIPSSADNATVVAAIHDQAPLNGMTLDALDVSKDADGLHVIRINLSVQDIETANQALPSFMRSLPVVLNRLRTSQGAQIASFSVELVDANNQPLLKYAKDFLPSEEAETWWQAPDLTQSWFPHPISDPAENLPDSQPTTVVPSPGAPYPHPGTANAVPIPHAYPARR